MISHKEVWGVYVLEDTDNDVCFYCIGLFYREHNAEQLKNDIQRCIDETIDRLEEEDTEFFRVEDCDNEDVKEYLVKADLKEGIQVRNCNYKIFVSSEVIYK